MKRASLVFIVVRQSQPVHSKIHPDKKLEDPYENIYTVVRGQKRFTLFPPTEGLLLKGMSLNV